MNKLITLATFAFMASSTYAQSFQLGFAAGAMANYPVTTPHLSANQFAQAKNTNVLTGLYARYDTKAKWSASITASMYNKTFSGSDTRQEPSGQSFPGIYIIDSYSMPCSFYLLDFSLQYNLNKKATLKNKNFKGIKSYIGITYTAIESRRSIHATEYDVVNNYNEHIEGSYNIQYRALGLSYYAAYSISKRLVLSLNICGRINTEDLKHEAGKVEYNELDPDYYLSAAFGIAYRITK